MKEKKFYNISLELDKNSYDLVVNLGIQLSNKAPTLHAIDGVNFFPHVSLYGIEIEEDKLLEVIQILEKITSFTASFEMTLKAPKKGRTSHIISFFETIENAKDIQRRIISELEPVREGHIPEKYKSKTYFSKEELENLNKYGYSDALSTFTPHLTFVKYENEQDTIKVINDFKLSFNAVKFGSISISEVDGNKATLIKDFSFAQ